MRYHCRCRRRSCQARQVKAKHPDEYKRPPKCVVCKKGELRVDGWMQRRNTGHPSRCNCLGYWFPHRHGSKWCLLGEKYLRYDPAEMPTGSKL